MIIFENWANVEEKLKSRRKGVGVSPTFTDGNSRGWGECGWGDRMDIGLCK